MEQVDKIKWNVIRFDHILYFLFFFLGVQNRNSGMLD